MWLDNNCIVIAVTYDQRQAEWSDQVLVRYDDHEDIDEPQHKPSK